MSKTRVNELQSLVAKLQADREVHVDAIAQIDAAFDGLGITMPKRNKRGRKPGKKKAVGKRSKKRVAKKKATKKVQRKKSRTTATAFVLATIKKAGTKGVASAQVNKSWKAAGRPGGAYNTLGILFKENKIKREKIKDGKGSVYRLA